MKLTLEYKDYIPYNPYSTMYLGHFSDAINPVPYTSLSLSIVNSILSSDFFLESPKIEITPAVIQQMLLTISGY